MMHILCEINTNPITYPIDTHRRRRLIPMLSHIPHEQIQALHPPMHTYILCPTQIILNTKNTKIYQVFYIKIKYKIYNNKRIDHQSEVNSLYIKEQ